MKEQKNKTIENFENSLQTAGSSHLGDADTGWLAIFGKVAPILGGVGAIGSLINSVFAAQQTAEFQEKLINELQAIEQTLQGIKNDLDAIYQELKNIEQDIEGLGLNDKLTAIDTWSMEMAALDPTDTHGARELATAMLEASAGETNLLACMVGIHNAMVGESIGTPLITLMDAPAFIRLRARLVRGLHLLAFATAMNTKEKYDYGVFLLEWATNFQQQTNMYLAADKDTMVFNDGHYAGAPDFGTCDNIVLYKYAQPQLDNVSIALVRPNYNPLVFYSGSVFSPVYNDTDILSVKEVLDQTIAFFDLDNNEFTFDKTSPLAAECLKATDTSHYWLLYIAPITAAYGNLIPQCTLMCTARIDETQTFLGAAAGQMHWLEATGDNASLVSSIHDGTTTDASVVVYDMHSEISGVKAFTSLQSMSEALWTTTWIGKDKVTITLSANIADPVYLVIDSDGNWVTSMDSVTFDILECPDPVPGPIKNPLTMSPIPVVLRSAMGGQKSVLFRQF